VAAPCLIGIEGYLVDGQGPEGLRLVRTNEEIHGQHFRLAGVRESFSPLNSLRASIYLDPGPEDIS
jgi:hypothetical protein